MPEYTKEFVDQWIKAAVENDLDALIDAIACLFNVSEADIDPDTGRIWISGPMTGSCLDDEDRAALVRAIEVGALD